MRWKGKTAQGAHRHSNEGGTSRLSLKKGGSSGSRCFLLQENQRAVGGSPAEQVNSDRASRHLTEHRVLPCSSPLSGWVVVFQRNGTTKPCHQLDSQNSPPIALGVGWRSILSVCRTVISLCDWSPGWAGPPQRSGVTIMVRAKQKQHGCILTEAVKVKSGSS